MTTPILPGTSGGLAEALNILLDKGLVLDASIKITVIGIEVLTIEIKVIIASVDTYIRYLEAMQRLELARQNPPNGQTPTPAPQVQGIAGTYGLMPAAPVGVIQAPPATVERAPEEK
ncbi:hypothetical protein JOF56_003093 [Kibdelosporangium banguiense]|uniref:Gas vesicle structural protein n=1 Tax=Kibdelosporangium banguiense TaxID=1365924 RepID=A0ABS4TE72_9PSEU|nr:gas vesicle protein GvpJ [Kibdelosporangium banguiense]MBP2322708.1 hypothetical protein [Kibdelosporangium banguiense]